MPDVTENTRRSPILFAECTWEHIASLDPTRTVLVLPVGSTEPHGPHLPLSTDVIISEGMAERAALALRRQGFEAYLLPSILYSVTDFARGFAGAISLKFETACAVLVDVLTGAAECGFRYFAVANSHLEPEHVRSLVEAFRRFQDATGIPVAFPDKRRRRWAKTLTDEFLSGACHAGQYETSLVLARRPDLVCDDIRVGLPDVQISLSEAIMAGKSSFREAGSDRAYFGFPASASESEGAATYEKLAEMLLISLKETYQLDVVFHHD